MSMEVKVLFAWQSFFNAMKAKKVANAIAKGNAPPGDRAISVEATAKLCRILHYNPHLVAKRDSGGRFDSGWLCDYIGCNRKTLSSWCASARKLPDGEGAYVPLYPQGGVKGSRKRAVVSDGDVEDILMKLATESDDTALAVEETTAPAVEETTAPAVEETTAPVAYRKRRVNQ
jgi:hypothetical protein